MSRKRDTKRGFGDPGESSDELTQPSTIESAPRGAGTSVEIEFVHEHGSPTLLSGPWRSIEIWTQNRIYGLDATLTCREVVNRAAGGLTLDHPTLGQRLLGGQIRDGAGNIVQVSHPLPERGASAVFAAGFGKRLKVSETTVVTRVVIRQRVVDVEGPTPQWEALSDPGPSTDE